MRATEVLQKCLHDTLDSMHALRRRVLLRAVEAMIQGSRPTLIDLARSWPGAMRVRAPLKALDRLLGNGHLHGEREHVYKAMTRWLVCSKNAQRESEPWLLVASPSLTLSARQLITLYGRRMQIELSFRDLKSHRYGQCFEDSLTRKGARIEVLLLLSAMAAFASWLVGMACESCGIDTWLAPFRSK